MTLLELYEEKYGENKYEVVAATVNRRLRELSASVKPDDEVEFIKTNSIIGFDLYKRSIILLMLKAAKDVLGKPEGDYKIDVMYSISKGYFCRLLDTDEEMNDELIGKIKARMEELVEQDLPIKKMVCSTAEMREYIWKLDSV